MIDTTILIKRKIIKENQNIDSFFFELFKDEKLADLLKKQKKKKMLRKKINGISSFKIKN